jgi:hypothetical protein
MNDAYPLATKLLCAIRDGMDERSLTFWRAALGAGKVPRIRTHCRRGHPRDGHSSCRVCANESRQLRRARGCRG